MILLNKSIHLVFNTILMQLPHHLSPIAPFLFIFSTLFCMIVFYWVLRGSTHPNSNKLALKATSGLIVWIALQLLLSHLNIYSTGMEILPPKIVLFGVLPNIILLIFLFNYPKSKALIDSLPLKRVTAIHIVRIFVEIGLFYLFLGQAIPEIMTFSGQNFDILAGLTAPLIIYFGFIRKQISRRLILLWNVISLGLLCYIIVLAFLSTPSPFQQLGFEQPNIAIFHFPFSWLPTFIVPIVIFMHLVSIRQLIYSND